MCLLAWYYGSVRPAEVAMMGERDIVVVAELAKSIA
jgi:hypothetical protein